jgi:gluconate 2-dehydrogenase gamma chain
MSNPIDRRTALAQIAAAALAGPIGLAQAQHVHHETAAAASKTSGVYQPKALTRHEYDTLRGLSETIVPGASKGGAVEFIDLLSSQNPELLAIYTGGLAWLDDYARREYGSNFSALSAQNSTAILDKIAYRQNETPELAPGIHFFTWARRMTVDAYYSSAPGIKEVGFMGNRALKEFVAPQDIVDLAVKRSGL